MHGCGRFALPMMLGLILLLVGGCASWDRHVFESTDARPLSVALVDAGDGETLWRYDIPPRHRLTVDLANSAEVGAVRVSGRPATHMNWKVHRIEPGAMAGIGEIGSRRVGAGRVELERRPVRLDVDYFAAARRAPAPHPDAADRDEDAEADAEAVPDEDGDEPVEAAMAEADEAD